MRFKAGTVFSHQTNVLRPNGGNQAQQREVRVSSSTPANARTERSVFEISTISIRRRRDAEAAQCGRMARGAAVGRERFIEIRLRRSRYTELYSWLTRSAWERCSRPPRRSSVVSTALRVDVNGARQARLRLTFAYGSKHLSRSIDPSTSASTQHYGGQGRSRLETARPELTIQESIEQLHDTGDLYPRSARGALGVPSSVMKRSEAKWSLDRSTLDPTMETIRTAMAGASRLPDLRRKGGRWGLRLTASASILKKGGGGGRITTGGRGYGGIF
ncbi:hypothetical protein F5Y10DRAFT_267415 [Nemania abortiva]|nr:hypothetical protein F5Y10DRAFT_267415 [Nemania abortiva]